MSNSHVDQRYDLLLRAVVDYGIYMLDLDGRVVTWNPGAERIKGYTAEEIIGSHFSRFYAPEDVAAGLPDRGLKTATETGRFEAEGWRVRKNGERFWAMVVIDAVRDDDGHLIGFAKVTRDITEKREADLRLAETRTQLLQAQKMEALGQLTGGLAHDFNNLLTAIMGAAELAGRQAQGNERLQGLLDSIRSSAQRGGALTRQLLAFARSQPLESQTIDLRQQLPETIALLGHSMPAAVEVVSEISEHLWPAEADPAQLELALLNLAFNARDAMPGGGELKIAGRNAAPGETGETGSEYVVITVSDTGEGIPADILERVTEPFFTTKAFGQGTGLGLSQVYGFARQSGGELRIDSTPGEGTAVRLYLPRAGTSGAEEASSDPDRTHVLVVEDDAVIAELAGELLRELGYAPRVVHSATDALRELAAHDRYRLVFSDVIMPGGMTGLELARKIRERKPELPVLLTTGYSETAGSAREFPLLIKPYAIEDLSSALKSLIT